jgi:hypothetical protein
MEKRNMFVRLDVHKDSIVVAVAERAVLARSARIERLAATWPRGVVGEPV